MKVSLKNYLLFVLIVSSNICFSQINYVDIPDTTLTYKVHLGYNDSLNYIRLDINGDNIMDVGFLTRYRTKWMSPSNPNVPEQSMSYSHENNNSKIARGTMPCTKLFNANDTINSNNTWNNISDLYVSVYNAYYPCSVPYSDLYYGFQFFFGSQTHYGWIRVNATTSFLTIKDFAYNLSPNDPILAGQVSVGINELLADQNNIMVSEGKIIVKNKLHDIETVEVYTVLGSLVKTIKVEGEEVMVDMYDVSGSVLIVKVNSTGGVMYKKLYLPN